jgi:DUF218 domain
LLPSRCWLCRRDGSLVFESSKELRGPWSSRIRLRPRTPSSCWAEAWETRPFAAADLYKKGMARQIVISAVKASPAEKLDIVPSHIELNRAVLLKLGVPPDAIVSFGTDVSNTYEEARALAEWANRNGIKSIIVPTEIFSSRRVRWILVKELSGLDVGIQVQALPPLEYDLDNWWQHEAGVIGFQNEVIKYLYYRVKY